MLRKIFRRRRPKPPKPNPPPPVVPPPPAALEPNVTDGKPISQLGLFAWRFWTYEEPFIDVMKMNFGQFSAKTHGGATMTWPQMWAAGHIHKPTLWPERIPPGYDYIAAGRFRSGAIVAPSHFAGTYVATWEGDADVGLGAGQVAINANRAEITVAADDTSIMDVRITRIGAGGIRNLRIFRKTSEARLTSGAILDPRFVAHASRYKILRFLDPQDASEGRPFRPGDFATMAQATWAPDWTPDYANASDAPKQPPFEVIFKTAVETNTAAWVHIAGLPGAPSAFNSLVNADPFLWRAAMQTHLSAILASSDWATYCDAIIAGAAAAGYPRTRMLYLEPWNEVWNFGGAWARMTHACDGVNDFLGGQATYSGFRYGYGYMCGHVQREFEAALARANRSDQRWTLVCASQHAAPERTTAAMEGYRRYWSDRGITGAANVAKFANVGVATASYYADGLSRTDGAFIAGDDAAHLTMVKAAITAGTASDTLENWYLNAPTHASARNLNTVIARRNEHQAIAVSYGAFFLGDYEGESHEIIPSHLIGDSQVKDFMETFIKSAAGARVTTAWASRLAAQNTNAVIANYFSIYARGPANVAALGNQAIDPWYDGLYGETNGRLTGLTTMLRNPL